MIIKIWNNYDCGVYRVNSNIKKIFKKQIKKLFSPEQEKQLRQMAKELGEELSLVFEHNLHRGWENKILAGGTALDKDGKREFKTAQEIRRALSCDGQIQFHARRKNGSMSFIQKIKKPVHLRW